VGDVREEQLRLPPRAAQVLPVHAQLEPGLLEWAQRHGLTRYAEPILIHIYSEVLQKFRLAAQGKSGMGKQPPEHLRKRIETYFDPLPFYYEPLEAS
jgi:sulfite dehydrogenase (quinone) subunit SoeA